jgi:hypothetical protein
MPALLLAMFGCLAYLLLAAGPALAEEAQTAPKLDYHFDWLTFLICVVAVIGFYTMLYAVSFKEFKGVIDERFGPKREGG